MIAKGPVSAYPATLKDLGWKAPAPLSIVDHHGQLRQVQGEDFEDFQELIKDRVIQQMWAAAAKHRHGAGLEGGPCFWLCCTSRRSGPPLQARLACSTPLLLGLCGVKAGGLLPSIGSMASVRGATELRRQNSMPSGSALPISSSSTSLRSRTPNILLHSSSFLEVALFVGQRHSSRPSPSWSSCPRRSTFLSSSRACCSRCRVASPGVVDFLH